MLSLVPGWEPVWNGSHTPGRGMDMTGNRLELWDVPAVFTMEHRSEQNLNEVKLYLPARLAPVYRHLHRANTTNESLRALGLLLRAYGPRGVAVLWSAGGNAVDGAVRVLSDRFDRGLPLR